MAVAANNASAARKAAEAAIQSIGLGYDVAEDLRLKYCKRSLPDSKLIAVDDGRVQDIMIPGGISIRNVPKSIKLDKGERMRFRSDVLSFQQVDDLGHVDLSGIWKIKI